ncbi:MAG: hypothetical protein ACXVRJ_13495 [Gaiellaceae bacterium]
MAHAAVRSQRILHPRPVAAVNPPQKRSLGDWTKALAVLLVLPAVLFAAVLLYARYETTRTTAPPPGHHGALVWDDGGVIFANTNEVAAWVRFHGSSFQSFKRNHPAALQLVKGMPSSTSHVKLAAGKSTPTKTAAPVATVVTTSSRNWIGLSILGTAGVLLLLLSLAPIRVLAELRLTRGDGVGDLRMITFAASAAIFAGLAFVLLI